MNAPLDFGRCLTFINCQLMPNAKAVCAPQNLRWRVVTISRQAGTGGHIIAENLARQLEIHAVNNGALPWVVFDRDLVEKVLSEHHLPARLAKFMPENRVSAVHDTLDELFGLHPPTWTLVEKTGDTILRLAKLGHVILIGRGANIITQRLEYVLHVRLVGALDARVEFVRADKHLNKKAALELVEREDDGRRKYLKKYFHKDIDDPQLYHLIINTPAVGHIATAKLIADILSGSYEASVSFPARQ